VLALGQVSLLRAGDYAIDNDQLEIDTYHKLNNMNYKAVLNNIKNSFFTNQISESYNAVKDSSWPDVTTLEEFEQLPISIKQECLDQHHLELLQFDKDHPNCPRHLLREFFQIGFENPAVSGFMIEQEKMLYPGKDVYIFPFCCFYNTTLFVEQCKKIASWASLQFDDYNNIILLHEEFMKRQPYAQSKQKCDRLLAEFVAGNTSTLPKLTLMEEAYFNAQLKRYNHVQSRY
jgi:hypothetical protein